MREELARPLCACGCGRQLGPVIRADRLPPKYLRGHNKRKYAHGARCSVEGCERAPEAQGLCHGHFEYQRRHGIAPTAPILDNDWDRFHAKIKVLPIGHWMWTGATASGGWYGAATLEGRVQPAHRVAWQLYRGPIPDDYEIDHLCRKGLCVNPDHLEPVPPRVNSLRSESPAAHNAAKTHCIRGHEFTPENTLTRGPDDHTRRCRTCARNRPRESSEVRAARHAARADEINAQRRAQRAARTPEQVLEESALRRAKYRARKAQH